MVRTPKKSLTLHPLRCRYFSKIALPPLAYRKVTRFPMTRPRIACHVLSVSLRAEMIAREMDLVGKNAIVTGASRGLGRGIALQLASRGANVLGTCSKESSLKNISAMQDQIQSYYRDSNLSNHEVPRIVGVVAPLGDSAANTASIVAALKKDFNGSVDILVQSAALQETVPLEAVDQQHVDRMLTANISTAVLLVQALLPFFRPSSRIVNISSEGARQSQTAPVTLLYSATKAALESMTRVWADALGQRPGMEGTTVNSVIAGVTKTGDTATGLPEGLPDIEPVRQLVRAKMAACSVGERLGEINDVADVVGFLCAEKSRWISGSAVCANGGTVKIL